SQCVKFMVARVVRILGGLRYMEHFNGIHRHVAEARKWSQAFTNAEDAIERAQLGEPSLLRMSAESQPGGFRREITRRPWQPGLTLVTVTVFLPGSGRFDLDWLAPDRPDQQRGSESP